VTPDLNLQVTEAILAAETLPPGSPEAKVAFCRVSEIEEAIARQKAATSLEGFVARLGAVTAALSAGEPKRALELATRYEREVRHVRWGSQKLRELMQEAAELL